LISSDLILFVKEKKRKTKADIHHIFPNGKAAQLLLFSCHADDALEEGRREKGERVGLAL